MQATTLDAYNLLHDGGLALSRVEANGIRINETFLDKAIHKVALEVVSIETAIRASPIWSEWRKRYADRANMRSRTQLGDLLFGPLGYKATRVTDKTGRAKVDKEALEDVDIDFTRMFLRKESLMKLSSAYLKNLKRETVNGFFHPIFHLHTARSFRSSSGGGEGGQSASRDLNFQNLPVRDPELAKVIRRCFIARDKDWQLVENDLKAIEVCVAACYNQDPTLIDYIKNPKSDMHKDMAAEVFKLKSEQVSKLARYAAKNMFVFPQFYGSFYIDCAKSLWRAMVRLKLMVEGTAVSIRDHLASKGITKLGDCDPESDPEPGTFEHHVQKVERKFWQERFEVYDQWKKDWYDAYTEKGWFELKTGFRVEGYMKRNQVINIPIQGSAFHVPLKGIVLIDNDLRRYKMRSRIVGQVHDSIVGDCPKNEVKDYNKIVNEVLTERIPKLWKWINVPLTVEAEVSPPGRSWYEKEAWHG